jgi:hypothetical protein
MVIILATTSIIVQKFVRRLFAAIGTEIVGFVATDDRASPVRGEAFEAVPKEPNPVSRTAHFPLRVG